MAKKYDVDQQSDLSRLHLALMLVDRSYQTYFKLFQNSKYCQRGFPKFTTGVIFSYHIARLAKFVSNKIFLVLYDANAQLFGSDGNPFLNQRLSWLPQPKRSPSPDIDSAASGIVFNVVMDSIVFVVLIRVQKVRKVNFRFFLVGNVQAPKYGGPYQ